MAVKDDNGTPQAPIAGKEPWETPLVFAAAIDEATNGDDYIVTLS